MTARRRHARHRPPARSACRAQLSGGQRQRVAIGRAIVRDARLFLFDEPLVATSMRSCATRCAVEIKRLHQELGRTMIYVTHDQIEAMTLADRIVLLRDGRIEQQGSPLDLFERPATRFVAGFLGSPKMNFIPATLSGNAATLSDGTKLALVGQARGEKPSKPSFSASGRSISPFPASALPWAMRGCQVTVELVQPTGSRVQVDLSAWRQEHCRRARVPRREQARRENRASTSI